MLAKILNLSNMKVDEEVDGSLQKKKKFYRYLVEDICSCNTSRVLQVPKPAPVASCRALPTQCRALTAKFKM
jgi:hypothetical protein